ncbi:GroES-like protein [Delitschia confertaspora ATCC 74209]|uniref:GroES-like protein n=1 Tax=Delitschia confertaspora ATCC 74209 TaxID=1513339 RepID=A0A9P4MT55_9PLEO|nr:GroES-like protein [Delitschia confertaspora ATCC 74209]
MIPWPFTSRGKRVIQGKYDEDPPVPAFQSSPQSIELPHKQTVLLLHAPREPYQLTSDYELPTIKNDDELLVRVRAAGLNPIDWKAPDFNFGIPTLPYISGRELVGEVIVVPRTGSWFRKGDIVIIPSTDYRDVRKAAFQEYAIGSSYNTIRLPSNTSVEAGSILGVAFVAAALALGICMGVDFSGIADGPDLWSLVQNLDPRKLPVDIQKECLKGICENERAKEGDYLVVWGGSSTCAYIIKQLARLSKLRIISVTDTRKHGIRLSNHASIRPDLLVDSHDPVRAVEIIRSVTSGKARFGFDTQGKDTAAHLFEALQKTDLNASLPIEEAGLPASSSSGLLRLPTPPFTLSSESLQPLSQSSSHLIGLTGLPKTEKLTGTKLHSVPIKLFHEVPEVGEVMVRWCERLLVEGLLVPPDVIGVVEGLEGVNEGLNRLRRGDVSGGRLVCRVVR